MKDNERHTVILLDVKKCVESVYTFLWREISACDCSNDVELFGALRF
jgi:hypothetical protein